MTLFFCARTVKTHIDGGGARASLLSLSSMFDVQSPAISLSLSPISFSTLKGTNLFLATLSAATAATPPPAHEDISSSLTDAIEEQTRTDGESNLTDAARPR